MKKIMIMCCIMLAMLPCIAKGVDTNKARLVKELDMKPGKYDFLKFYGLMQMKKNQCVYAGGLKDFSEIIHDACSNTKTISTKSGHLQLFKIDTTFSYEGNETIVRDEILGDSICDLRTPSGCAEARKRLGILAQIIKKYPPSPTGLFEGWDEDQSLCLGWFTTQKGATFQGLFYCNLLDGKYVWYLWARPSTGTVGLKYRHYISIQ